MTSRNDRRVSGVVRQDVTLKCIDSVGRGHDLNTVFSYTRTEPFAVTITFVTPEGDLPWTFSRDLLVHGLTDPSGQGDVHVCPSIDDQGRAVVIIELSSPDGHLVTQVRTDDMYQFVNETLEVVPEGEESHYLDLDEAITQLLRTRG